MSGFLLQLMQRQQLFLMLPYIPISTHTLKQLIKDEASLTFCISSPYPCDSSQSARANGQPRTDTPPLQYTITSTSCFSGRFGIRPGVGFGIRGISVCACVVNCIGGIILYLIQIDQVRKTPNIPGRTHATAATARTARTATTTINASNRSLIIKQAGAIIDSTP